jgi:hypothetical protein
MPNFDLDDPLSGPIAWNHHQQQKPREGNEMASPPVQTPQKPPSRMTLASITRGVVDRPPRILIYGMEGIGKSSFAAGAPSTAFIPVEEGLDQIDAFKFPKPETWDDVLEAIDVLTFGQHDHKFLAVDTLDALEALCWAHVVARAKSAKIKSIEDFGYGKGFTAALEEWRVFMARLERLWKTRNMGIILIAHSWIKTFKNPEDEDYDRYQMKLHDKAAGALRDWCDATLFTRYETFVNTDEKTKRSRGVSTGARVIHTQRTAAWDAKNRYDLPETLPLEWQAFADAVAAHKPLDAATLKARIAKMLEAVTDDELRAKVIKAIEAAGDDAARLAKVSDNLSARIGIQTQETAQ